MTGAADGLREPTPEEQQEADSLDEVGKGPKPLGDPGMFHHFGRGLGDSAMGGLARVGRAAAVAGYAPLSPFLTDRGKDAYFENVVGATENAVDYWTPDATNVGTAGRVANGLVQGLIPLLAGPEALIATAGLDSSIEVVKGGGTVKQAVAVGTINAAATAVGYKMPAAWGSTLITRAATGAGGNVAIDAASRVAAQATLADNPDLAEQYAVTGESMTISALMGSVFGVAHHVGAGKVPREATRAERDAVLTVSNAEHYTRETMPGAPRDGAAVTAHQTNLESAIKAALNDEPLNVPHQDLGGLFNLRPEVAGAPDVGGYDSMRIALESGGRSDAAASTSGALGRDQFIPDTWRRVVGKAQPAWADGLTDEQLLAARKDPAKSAEMEQVLRAENAHALRAGGVEVTAVNLYAAHHFGAGKGVEFARAAGDTPIEQILTAGQIKANPYLAGKTRDQVIANWNNRAGRAAGRENTAPGVLADVPSLYFNLDESTPTMRVKDLFSTKDAEDNAPNGIRATAHMADAAEGLLAKREPIEVLRNVDGTAHVVDGNGTLTAAQSAGFERLPVRVVGEQAFADQLARLDLAPEIRAKLAGLDGFGESLAQHYADAAAIKPEFDAGIRAVAASIGSMFEPMIPANLKGVARATEKAVGKYGGDVSRVRDLVRGTIVVNSPADVPRAIAELKSQFGEGSLGELENTLDPAAKSKGGLGYRDANTFVTINGHSAELQINTPEMIAAKNGPGHALYEKYRTIAERVFSEGRDPTPQEAKELDRLEAAQVAVYDAATAATAARNSSSDTSFADLENSAMFQRRSPSESQARQTYSGVSDTGIPSSTPNRVPAGNFSGSSMSLTSNEILTQQGFNVLGADSTVVTERGLRLPVRWAVVDVASLVTSHDDALRINPEFPAELQPRDRQRAASEQQITRIANAINPELLADSPKAADGAPIVGADKVVESGNARTIALRRAYASGKADAYRAYLVDNAERFGVDPAALDGVEQPMLVRVALEEGRDRADFARQANESTVAGMSSTEQALADARHLPDMGDLQTHDDGTINMRASAKFVAGFIEGVGPNERANMSTADGDLSQQGQARIRNAVFAKAYGDPELVALMAEATDANVKNVLAGMLRSAPAIARLREMIAEGGRYGPDISGDLVQAVRKFSQLRRDGVTVEQFEAQGDFFGEGGLTPRARDLLRTVGENARAPKRMAEFLQRYVDAVEVLGDPRQADLMGGSRADAATAIDTAANATRAANDQPAPQAGSLFNAAGRATAEAAPVITPENRAAYEVAAAMPDLQVVGDDGVLRPVAEHLAQSDAEAVQAAETQRAIEAAANCFVRNAA